MIPLQMIVAPAVTVYLNRNCLTVKVNYLITFLCTAKLLICINKLFLDLSSFKHVTLHMFALKGKLKEILSLAIGLMVRE